MLTPLISMIETKSFVEEKRKKLCIDLGEENGIQPHSTTMPLL